MFRTTIRGREPRTGLARFCGSLAMLVLMSVLAGCGDDSGSSTAPDNEVETHALPDGTSLAIPSGSTYWYSHVEVSGGTGQFILPGPGPGRLVISRIDWSFCNPKTARLEFLDEFSAVVPWYTWRVPTVVETPLAGISILGIFSGNNLEGGLQVPLYGSPGGVDGVAAYRVTSCDADWISLYGYYIID